MFKCALVIMVLAGILGYTFFRDTDIEPTPNNAFFTETYKEAR